MSQTKEKSIAPFQAENELQAPELSTAFSRKPQKTRSLRWKATIIGILLGTIPVVTTGWLAYRQTASTIEKNITGDLEHGTRVTGDAVTRFMLQRIGDIELLGRLPLLSDPLATPAQKKSYLDFFLKAYSVYDSVVFINPKGEIIVESGAPSKNFNFFKTDYFIAATQSQKSVVAIPRLSKINQKFALFFASPVLDNKTNNVLGVIRTRSPIQELEKDILKITEENYQYYLVDPKGNVFSGIDSKNNQKTRGKAAKDLFPGFKEAETGDKVTISEGTSKETNRKIIMATVKIVSLPGQVPINWQTLVLVDREAAYQPLYNLQRTILLGTLLTALITALIAVLIANSLTKPIVEAAQAVEKVGSGDLDVRLKVQGNDELAVLGANINVMTARLKELLETQKDALQAQAQMATQAELTREQQEAKEFLQNRALELLQEIAPLRKGDLTIRATVTEDEMGTIADSYNAVIKSLRRIVEKVQQTSSQVSTTANTSEELVQDLVTDAFKQTESLNAVLARIEQMNQSIATVSSSASSAEEAVKKAAQVVQDGDELMNQTVKGILDIRETVAETTKKVKRLGESSQRISKVVNLISSFAAQTNLLALNASIEAARAGEEGRGFAVVADEVRALARASTTATSEIEQLVANIQTETKDVVLAMEAGTEQVVLGTQLVEKSRQSLTQINEVSNKVSELVRKISQLSVEQSNSSVEVSQTILEVSQTATETSKGATEVLIAFKELVELAEGLQTSVSQFKL